MDTTATDIRIKVGFIRHRKTRKLRRMLGADAVLCLVELWCYTAVNHPKGDLSGMTDEEMADVSGWPEDRAGDFAPALREVGFMDPGNILHDWKEHQEYVYYGPERSDAARDRANVKWGRYKRTRSGREAEARSKGTHSNIEWEAMKAMFDGICPRCAKPADLQRDHITPIYQGGPDSIENIQPLCKKCNRSKGPEATDFRPANWRQRLEKSIDALRRHARSAPAPAPGPDPVPAPDPALRTREAAPVARAVPAAEQGNLGSEHPQPVTAEASPPAEQPVLAGLIGAAVASEPPFDQRAVIRKLTASLSAGAKMEPVIGPGEGKRRLKLADAAHRPRAP